MSEKKILLIIWLLAVLVRLTVLVWVRDANYVAGMAQGELAYAITTGKGITFDVLPGCGIIFVQNAQNRLIDVQDYLENYPAWCDQIGMTQKPPQEMSINPVPAQMPGMGFLLAGTYRLFGQYRYIYLQVIVLLLDSLGVWMIFWIGKTWFEKKAGFLAALFYAFYLPGVRISAAGGIRDAWMPVFYTTCLFLFLHAVQDKCRMKIWYVLLGAIVGAGVYLRPEVLFLPVVLAGLLWIVRKCTLTETLRAMIWMVLPVIIFLCPWWVRNYALYHRFMLTTPQMIGTIWESFGEFDQPGQKFWRLGNPFGAVYDADETYIQYVREGGKGGFLSEEYQAHFDKKVRDALINRPDWYALLLVRRVVEIPIMGFDWGIDLSGVNSRIGHALISRGGTILLFGAALLGILANIRDWRNLMLLLSVAIYNWAIHLPISVNGRYLFPAYAGLIILAAVGIVHLYGMMQHRIFKRQPE